MADEIIKPLETPAEEGVVIISKPLDVGFALDAESVLDYDLASNDSLCVKATLDTAPLTLPRYQNLVSSMEIGEAGVDKIVATYGHASLVEAERQVFRQDELFDGMTPYTVELNMYREESEGVCPHTGLRKWLNREGPLPCTVPLWEGITTPQFTLRGTGSRQLLHRESLRFGLFHYLEFGRETWTILPKSKSDELNDSLRTYLHEQQCPTKFTSCPFFLQDCQFHFDKQFLMDEFGAIQVELKAGEALFLQSNVFYEVETLQPSLTVAYNCIPKTWLSVQPFPDCEHTTKDLLPDSILAIHETATNFKNHVAKILAQRELRKTEPFVDVMHPEYTRTIRIQSKELSVPWSAAD